jgi:hypothetical protein
MSSTNQRLIEQAKDDYNTDYAPYYRQDIFGEVYLKRPAYERRLETAKDQLERTWLDHQRTMDGAMEQFREAADGAIKSSEERNEAVNRLIKSF